MRDLADRLRRIADRLQLESDALERALEYAWSDPSGSANKAGIVVEALLKRVVAREGLSIRRGASIGEMRDTLRGVIPPVEDAQLELIQRLRNVGSHDRSAVVNPTHAYGLLAALTVFATWYLDRYDALSPQERFEDRGPLGQGGMCEVRRAWDRQWSEECALKRLKPDLAADPTLSQRFEAEARTMRRIQHPRVLRIDEICSQDGAIVLKMPVVGCGSLADRLVGHITETEAGRWSRDLLEALVAVHAAGVVHRDVKPSNLLIGDDGHIVLADFGVALDTLETRLTRTGEVPGTLAWMAPEQLRGGEVTLAADVYSAGRVLDELWRRAGPPEPPVRQLIEDMKREAPQERPTAARALAMWSPPPGATAASTKAPPHLLARAALLWGVGAAAHAMALPLWVVLSAHLTRQDPQLGEMSRAMSDWAAGGPLALVIVLGTLAAKGRPHGKWIASASGRIGERRIPIDGRSIYRAAGPNAVLIPVCLKLSDWTGLTNPLLDGLLERSWRMTPGRTMMLVVAALVFGIASTVVVRALDVPIPDAELRGMVIQDHPISSWGAVPLAVGKALGDYLALCLLAWLLHLPVRQDRRPRPWLMGLAVVGAVLFGSANLLTTADGMVRTALTAPARLVQGVLAWRVGVPAALVFAMAATVGAHGTRALGDVLGDDPDAWVRQVEADIAGHRYLEALGTLEDRARQHPDDPTIWLYALELPRPMRQQAKVPTDSPEWVRAVLVEDSEALAQMDAEAEVAPLRLRLARLLVLRKQGTLRAPVIPTLFQDAQALAEARPEALQEQLGRRSSFASSLAQELTAALDTSKITAVVREGALGHWADDGSELWRATTLIDRHWTLDVQSPGGPDEVVQVNVERVPGHNYDLPCPKVLPAELDVHGLDPAARRRLMDLLSGEAGMAWSAPKVDRGLRDLRAAPLGQWFEVPAAAVGCETETLSGWGTLQICGVQLHVSKSALPAGPYRVSSRTVRGLGPSEEVWFPQMVWSAVRLPDVLRMPGEAAQPVVPVSLETADGRSPWVEYLRQAPLIHDPGHPYALLARVCWVPYGVRYRYPGQDALERVHWDGTHPVSAVGEAPTVFFDVDDALWDSSGQPNTREEWSRYTDAVFSRGLGVRTGVLEPASNCAELPLPALPVGEYTVCLGAQMPSGARSSEVECLSLQVQVAGAEGYRLTDDDIARRDAFDSCSAFAEDARRLAGLATGAYGRRGTDSTVDRALFQLFIDVDNAWVLEQTRHWPSPDAWGRFVDVRQWCQVALRPEDRAWGAMIQSRGHGLRRLPTGSGRRSPAGVVEDGRLQFVPAPALRVCA